MTPKKKKVEKNFIGGNYFALNLKYRVYENINDK